MNVHFENENSKLRRIITPLFFIRQIKEKLEYHFLRGKKQSPCKAEFSRCIVSYPIANHTGFLLHSEMDVIMKHPGCTERGFVIVAFNTTVQAICVHRAAQPLPEDVLRLHVSAQPHWSQVHVPRGEGPHQRLLRRPQRLR